MATESLTSIITDALRDWLYGPAPKTHYDFKGPIGDEFAEFREKPMPGKNWRILYVEKADGKQIEYIERFVEYSPTNFGYRVRTVNITKKGETETTHFVNGNEVIADFFSEAQKQYNNYLEKILDTNKKRALDKLD